MTERTVFQTSRLLEFTTVEELTKLAGCAPEMWPVAIVKEAADNAADACEDAGIAPEIAIAVDTKASTISVRDNGPGIASKAVAMIIDYAKKTSSREAPRRHRR